MITSQEVDRLIDTIWEPEDTEPTELTFRRTDEPIEQKGNQVAFNLAIVAACFGFMAFVLVGSW